ncbi:MAG TPA: hypothetical protein QGF58_28265 [Myxococcota bacterium]|nr:hypothetical protein [Myxococcota bacterium]
MLLMLRTAQADVVPYDPVTVVSMGGGVVVLVAVAIGVVLFLKRPDGS